MFKVVIAFFLLGLSDAMLVEGFKNGRPLGFVVIALIMASLSLFLFWYATLKYNYGYANLVPNTVQNLRQGVVYQTLFQQPAGSGYIVFIKTSDNHYYSFLWKTNAPKYFTYFNETALVEFKLEGESLPPPTI